MTRRWVGVAACLLSLLAGMTPAQGAPFTYPPPVTEAFPAPGPPEVSAVSWILYDDNAGIVIAEQNADVSRPVASVTKIMTGLLTLEGSDPSELVTVSEQAEATGEKEIDLVAGETVEMEALFKALMIHSANDAATAIAEYMSGSLDAFVASMNRRAEELGLSGTSFANPHGLDAPGHYSTARDMLTLTLVAMEHPEFADVVKARALVFPPAPDGSERRGSSTNLMLWEYPGTIGVKTGFTGEALLTFAAAAEREGHRLYAVVLGSEGQAGHFADATRLFDYGFEQLHYYGHALTGTPYTAMMARRTPDPVILGGTVEAFVHLAAQGLLLGRPESEAVEEEPEPGPVTEVTRAPDPAPATVVDAMRFLLDRALAQP